MNINERVLGAFYGFAVGDAMGATTEFMSSDMISKVHGKVVDIIGGGWLNIKAGEVTDDTQMMLGVANAVINSTGKDDYVLRCCKNFLDWYKSDPIDKGNQCKRVLQYFSANAIIKPERWMHMANKQSALGNGSLMRALPASLVSEELAVLQGALTHNNETCEQAISVYTRILGLIASGFSKEQLKKHYAPLVRQKVEPTGHVVKTLCNVMYWFLNTDSFAECIMGCVNDGGDADTIAAISGSIAGLYYGVQKIPELWLNKINGNILEQLKTSSDGILDIIKNGRKGVSW